MGSRGIAEHRDEPVRITPYDPIWPKKFAEERDKILRAIGEWVIGIEHVGSTAVPGLAAKPIIDIMAGVRTLEESRAAFAHIAELGYLYAPYKTEVMHWFCKPAPSRRTHHLHLVEHGSPRWESVLRFRDRLRARPEIAQEYEALKRGLARRRRHDRDAYTEAKTAFIQRVLDR